MEEEQNNPYTPPSADVTPEAGSGDLAGRGIRLLGSLIDGIIVAAIFWAIASPFGFWDAAMTGALSLGDNVAMLILGFLVFLAVNAWFLAKSGQTLGKRIVGTRIVSQTTKQILPLWSVVTRRYLIMQVLTAIPVVGTLFALVDVLFIFRSDRRCIHDLIAGTIVVRA